MTWHVIHADCIEAMRDLPEAGVDAVVTDPPYHLTFMGKAWDRPDDHRGWAAEALRVLKPGGHLLAFGGTRTYHRLTCALEDAGFEIRDCLAWLYGSGFPKSLDVSKAIDKAAGAAREVVGEREVWGRGVERLPDIGEDVPVDGNAKVAITALATPDAERWQGWGTALKPAFEPIVLARKPLSGTVAENVLEYGTGALNVDGCRIEMSEKDAEVIRQMGGFGKAGWEREPTGRYQMNVEGSLMPTRDAEPHPAGRWPANVILDPEAAEMLDEQSGERGDKGGGFYVQPPQSKSYRDGRTVQGARDVGDFPFHYGDSGGASRFFYTAKTSRSERERGVREYGEIDAESKRRFASGGRTQIDGEWVETHSDPVPMRNVHPTVKPVDLMQWLCRLITPPKGLILDPFLGSGSTGIAALREGFDFIGIEREAEYVEIARARIIGDAPLFNVEEVIAEDISP